MLRQSWYDFTTARYFSFSQRIRIGSYFLLLAQRNIFASVFAPCNALHPFVVDAPSRALPS